MEIRLSQPMTMKMEKKGEIKEGVNPLFTPLR